MRHNTDPNRWSDRVNIALLVATVVILALVLAAALGWCGCSRPIPIAPIVPARPCGIEPAVAPMLCDRVTRDGRRECAICTARGCATSTGIWCVADSCDDAECRSRRK